MTSSEEQRALRNLTELLAQDLSAVDPDELLAAAKQAEMLHDSAPDWVGRLAAAANRAGVSWPEIARRTGIAQTTVYRRAEPFL